MFVLYWVPNTEYVGTLPSKPLMEILKLVAKVSFLFAFVCLFFVCLFFVWFCFGYGLVFWVWFGFGLLVCLFENKI